MLTQLASCVWLCSPMNFSQPGSSIHGILWARIPEWVTISFSRGSFWPRDQTCISDISCTGQQILYHWATLEAPMSWHFSLFLILYLTAYYFYLNLNVSSLCKWLPFLNERVIVTQLCPTIYDPVGLLSARFLCPWNSPGKNTGVGCHFLLQGCFPKWFDNSKLLWNLKKRASSQYRQVSIIRAPVRTPCFLNFTLCGCVCWTKW